MSNCKRRGMTLFEFVHNTDSQPRNFYGNSCFNLQVCYCEFGKSNLVTSAHEGWYWTGGNAINNVAYSEEVQVPELTWRWFSTGAEIPRHFAHWARGEPREGFDEQYQTYLGCAAVNGGLEMRTFNCRTPLQYICEEIRED
jgi:hypothetical protein